MSHSGRAWLSRLARLFFCVCAIAYLATKISWHDTARLAARPEAACRIVGPADADPLTLEDPASGREFRAARSELARAADLPKSRRPIELGLRGALRGMRTDWMLYGLLALAPTTFLMAWRLKALLAIESMTISFREAVLLTLGGNFTNFALPLGTTGGDLYKAYHVAKRAARRTEAVTIVLLDRAIGLVNFVLLAGVAIMFSWRQNAIGQMGKLVGWLLIATGVGAAVYFSRRFRRWIRYDELLGRLPMGDRLRRIDQTAFSFRFHPGTTLVALLVTTLNNGCLALMIMCLARALGMPLGKESMTGADWGGFYNASVLALSVGFLIAALPISVQGLGLLEWVFLRVFAAGGYGTSSQVIALALAMRAAQLVWSLPGIAVILAPGFRMKRSTGDDEPAA